MSYASIKAHRGMALDAKRNDAYFAALKQCISPATTVLDLGAGVGIHGLMAAGLGARTVYFVEPESIIHTVVPAHQSRCRPTQSLHVVQDRVESVPITDQVDVIVSVLTGSFLLSEDLLPSLLHARERFLKPNGRLIPDAARMVVVPVHAPDVHAKHVGAWSSIQYGVDLSPARRYAANSVHYVRSEAEDCPYLAEPRLLQCFDFHVDEHAACNAASTFTVDQNTLCHGLLGWFEMRLGSEWVSTEPAEEPDSHWAAAFLPLDPPLEVGSGASVSIRVIRPEFGDWTWRAATHAQTREHSTFFGSPLTADVVRKTDRRYRPDLSQRGRLIHHVLGCFERGMTVEEIQDATFVEFGEALGPRYVVERMVRQLVAKFG